MSVETINQFEGQYRFLSNFWACWIQHENVFYPSVEHAYQAIKMRDAPDRIKFLDIKASEAKKLGRVLPMRQDWDQVKLEIMYELVKQKFSYPAANLIIKDRLLSTGDAILEEGNWWGDTYWGTVNGAGQNHLGKILMRVRQELREASN